MAYIGRNVDKISNVEVLDNITFDGSSSYTLQKNSVNFTPSSANTLLVSIDGVVQAGNFTVSGSTIDFGTAVAGTSTCDFILHYGVGLITTPSDGTVTTAKLADSSVTAAKITDATITAAKLASGTVQNQSAFRNIIINGDMSIAQRGTSQTSITSSGYYTLDRFRTAINNGGTWTQSQSTEVPTGQGFAKSLKMDCTTADTSLASGDFLHVQIPIEAQYLQYLKYGTSSAETLTLSFWVRSNKTGTYCICLQKSDNTRYDFVAEYSISSADTWEKKTITIAPDSNIQASGGAIDNDSGEGLKLKFTLLSSGRTGTNNTWNSSTPADATSNQVNLADDTANEWYITGVQLEAGTTASDFEFLPYDVNLERCYRYFQHHLKRPNEAYTGGFRSATSAQVGIQMFAEMRGNPSATYQGIRCHDMADGNNLDASAISFGGVSGDYRTAVWTIITCASGGTSGDVAIVHGQDTESSGILGFYMDAEL